MRYLNHKSKVLLYGSNLWYLGEGMLGPLFAVFTERIGGDIFDITWAWATYLGVTGILYILIGKILDKSKSKNLNEKVMVLGYALNAVFTFGYLLVASPWHLFIVQAGLGVAAAMANPTWNSLYAKYEDTKHGAWHWGLAGGGELIVTSLAIALSGFIVSYFSFQALFVCMGIIQTTAAVYQLQILKD